MIGGPADVVLSDMAANATGHAKTDHLKIMALVEAAADFARECWLLAAAFLQRYCKVAPRLSCWRPSSATTKPSSMSNRPQVEQTGRALFACERISWGSS